MEHIQDWHYWVGGAVLGLGVILRPLVKMVLTAWANMLVRAADQKYKEQPDSFTHEEKQIAAKDALTQTWAGRASPSSMLKTIRPGESGRPPKGGG